MELQADAAMEASLVKRKPARQGSGAREPRVLIVQTYVPQYRGAFFEGLKAYLKARGVHLDLVHGDPLSGAEAKSDKISVPWAIYQRNKVIRIGKRQLVYQPVVRLAASYDLVVVEQANKLLVNSLLLAMSISGLTQLAFWGHGRDFQRSTSRFERFLKRALMIKVHWWFAYNERSAAVVRQAGYPDEHITRVMNTIDDASIRRAIASVTPADLAAHRAKLGLKGQNVCVFVGGMYDKKRLRFLMQACERIRGQVPDFEMLMVGSGTDRAVVDEYAARHDWVISCGPMFDREKVMSLMVSKLLLMPGLVGLAIVDAFAAQVPIVTTAVPYHSPEIDYLEDGVNGVMVAEADSVDAFAAHVSALLKDPKRLEELRHGCLKAAERYTMQEMVTRFGEGVLRALALH